MLHSISSLSNAVQAGMNGMTIVKNLSLIVRLLPVASANLFQHLSLLIHSTASLFDSSKRMPPFLRIISDLSFTSGLSSALMASSAVWKRVSISS